MRTTLTAFVPAHKQTNEEHKPGQHVNPLGFTDKTLADYIARKTRQEAFNRVSSEKYLETVNNPLFREANALVIQAENRLTAMGMPLQEARNWICAWASGAGDGSY